MESSNRFIKVPVVLAFTPNYLVPAATCILSLLKSSKPTEVFEIICLLTESIPEKQKEKLRNLDPTRLEFRFLVLEGKLQDIYINEKFTVAASYRLLLPDLLPDYNKVVYLDCDIIVRNNLAELYGEVDLRGHYLAGVFEATLDFQYPHMEAIGSRPGTYVNSGFLVMNLELLRKDSMVPKFIEASKEKGLVFPDQDVLNMLCRGRILGISPIYNSIRTFFLPQYKDDFLKYYSKEDWILVHQQGNVHYTGAKPWNAFTIEFSTWWDHYEMLPETIKKEGNVSEKMKRLHKFSNTLVGNYIFNQGRDFYRRIKYGSI